MTYCLLACVSAFLAVALLVSPARERGAAGRLVLHRRLLDLCTELGSTRPLLALEAWDPWRACVGAVREHAANYEIYLGDRAASGAMVLGALGAALVVSWLLGSLWAWPVALACALAAVPVVARSLERARRDAVARAMPDLLRSLSSSLGAGKTLTQAIGYVGTHTPGDAGRAFTRASLAVQCGMSVNQALADLERSLDAPGVALLTCALVVSQRTGAPLDDLLNRSAALVEEQETLKAELTTKTAQVRLSARLVMALPVALVAFLAALTPDYRAGLATPVGLACLLIAIVLDAVALVAMKRIMDQVSP